MMPDILLIAFSATAISGLYLLGCHARNARREEKRVNTHK